MIIIQGVIIKEEIWKQQFLCNLNACKGACCIEGDWGAPLETSEMHTLDKIYEDIKPFLRPEGIAVIEEEGAYKYYKEPKEFGTNLLANGACVFMTRDREGIAHCGIEQAYNAGVTSFKKPISCHLYPVRRDEERSNGFETLRYDKWSICSAACSLGKQQKVRLFEFVKDALVRQYGEEFYEELTAAVAFTEGENQEE